MYTLLLLFIATAANAHTLFCPAANDLLVAYGNANLYNQGWTITDGGGAASRAAFNLLGGYVEYEIDVSRTNGGVNSNIYTISPAGLSSSGFNKDVDYCDGARTDHKWCLEIDWVESNGGCGGATALHTIVGPGGSTCSAWGCSSKFWYGDKKVFKMRIDYSHDGSYTVTRDGVAINWWDMQPMPKDSDKAIIAAAHRNHGAVIYSSQWVGWVPLEDSCGRNGVLAGSVYSVRDLKVFGTVVQGPQPTTCGSASSSGRWSCAGCTMA